MTDDRERTTRWFGKVSADSGQLQDYGDPEVDSYIRSLEDRILDLEALLNEVLILMVEMILMKKARAALKPKE
jgi:hypothetical protein